MPSNVKNHEWKSYFCDQKLKLNSLLELEKSLFWIIWTFQDKTFCLSEGIEICFCISKNSFNMIIASSLFKTNFLIQWNIFLDHSSQSWPIQNLIDSWRHFYLHNISIWNFRTIVRLCFQVCSGSFYWICHPWTKLPQLYNRICLWTSKSSTSWHHCSMATCVTFYSAHPLVIYFSRVHWT